MTRSAWNLATPRDVDWRVGRAIVIRADARALPLPDESVDLVITSPPYFALRSYTDGGEHYAGQIGSEATPAEFIAALVECTREMVRVLKPSGSIWVNLGDKYSTGTSGDRNNGFNERSGNASGKRVQERSQHASGPVRGLPPKCLLLLPERYRIACVDQLGLIARAVVIWSKPNGLPESVTDRVRRSHEDWVHLTKAPRYFSAVDEIREGYSPNKPWGSGAKSGLKIGAASAVLRGTSVDQQQAGLGNGQSRDENPLGKLPGSVWEIPTEPVTVPAELGVDHFAAFPTEWPRRIIAGWSPAGICVECGEGRRPVSVSENQPTQRTHNGYTHRKSTTITGYTCACPEPTAPTRPAVVLDPFGGTGTTALVAKALGRIGISVDMSADYCRLAQWRTNDPRQIAGAMRVEKPEPVHEAQMSLWEAS